MCSSVMSLCSCKIINLLLQLYTEEQYSSLYNYLGNLQSTWSLLFMIHFVYDTQVMTYLRTCVCTYFLYSTPSCCLLCSAYICFYNTIKKDGCKANIIIGQRGLYVRAYICMYVSMNLNCLSNE